MLAYNNTNVLFDRTWGRESKHDQILNENFNELLQKLDLKKMKFIVCSLGPGSFTGLRVSATFCKILSLSLGKIPIYGVSSFYFYAFSLLKSQGEPKPEKFNIYIPSIGKKFFKSEFTFNKVTQVFEENIDMSGAREHLVEEGSQSISTNFDYAKLASKRYASLKENSLFSPYVLRSTYLDFYPLFLRRSEAEEKVKI